MNFFPYIFNINIYTIHVHMYIKFKRDISEINFKDNITKISGFKKKHEILITLGRFFFSLVLIFSKH